MGSTQTDEERPGLPADLAQEGVHLPAQPHRREVADVASRQWFLAAVGNALGNAGSLAVGVVYLRLAASTDAVEWDRIAHAVTGRLRHRLRPGDVIGRLGDGELGLLAVGPAPQVAARSARLAACLTDPITLDGSRMPLHVTVGVAFARDRHDDPDAVLGRAVLAARPVAAFGVGGSVEGVADLLAHRIFSAGLLLASCSGQVDPQVARTLDDATDLLDAAIRELRTAVVTSQRAQHNGH